MPTVIGQSDAAGVPTTRQAMTLAQVLAPVEQRRAQI
jgi:hypothetical protein